tara:strand:- start:3019 stop:4887 length:1869 start_codon:yes stop_codon:yes gene_type:complete
MRYVSFSPYFSGLSNVIMSYEIFLSISYITMRKAILPPDVWLLFHSQDYNIHDWKKDDYVDIWEIFDKEVVTKEFNCIDFYDVPEFQGKFKELETERSYTGNMGKVFPDDSACLQSVQRTFSADHLIFSNKEYFDRTWRCPNCNINHSLDADFTDFSQDRKITNLNHYKNKFLHFENNLFGHYWYDIYPGNAEERNKLKNKINKCFRYKSKFYQLQDRVHEKLGKYNSVHIRRNDFTFVHPNKLESISNSDKLLETLYAFFSVSTPLYIATDEKDKSFFDGIRKKYDIYFYDDFSFDLSKLEKDAMEQVICSQSENFVGTYPSTYTKRINVMRGLEGRQATDDIGINLIINPKDRISQDIVNPWKEKNNSKRWGWDESSHPQWKLEKDDKYVNSFSKNTFYPNSSPTCHPPVLSKEPFKKIKIPDELYFDLYDEYSKMNFVSSGQEITDHSEWGKVVGGVSNIKKDPHLMRGGISEEFMNKAYNILTPIMEEWSGVELKKSWGYGVRSYPDGSVLGLHRDRIQTHVLSCIIFVDRKCPENWPLDFYDHDYNHHQVLFDEGDMLLYESLCVHGRSTPFVGEYYRNMYLHWRPSIWDDELLAQYKDVRVTFKDESELLKYYEKT